MGLVTPAHEPGEIRMAEGAAAVLPHLDRMRANLAAQLTAGEHSCKCGAHLVFNGLPGVGGSWMATDGERPGDFWCPGGSLHLPVDAAELFPLTCTFCRRACATHVLIWDSPDSKRPRGEVRTTALVCGGCAHRDEARARQIAASPASAWLFRLAPDNEETCDGQ